MRLPWLVVAASSFLTTPAFAHGGGLNAEGCHNDRNGGTGYHCHRGGGSRGGAAPRAQGLIGGSATFFANCSAARAAGAAPVCAGSPGYSRKLDRDGDGVGYE